MRLSEAIRLGAMLGPQARGTLNRQYRKYLFFGPVVRESCALGAAFEASGATVVERVYDAAGDGHRGFRGTTQAHKAGDRYREVQHEWASLMWTLAVCPECHQASEPLYRVIPHLNDKHRWTRERIADWVARFEPAETPDPRVTKTTYAEVSGE